MDAAKVLVIYWHEKAMMPPNLSQVVDALGPHAPGLLNDHQLAQRARARR
jgi:hypothetical protein